MTKISIIDERIPQETHINDMEIGDVFMSEDGKILMRIENEAASRGQIWLINLQTGRTWPPTNPHLSIAIPVKAEMKIS